MPENPRYSKTVYSLGYVPADSASIQVNTIPLIQTNDFIVTTNNWYINNKSGSTCVVTLPDATIHSGRALTFKNMQPQILASLTSNVNDIDSIIVGTQILSALKGNWATLVSDGTQWVIMQRHYNGF